MRRVTRGFLKRQWECFLNLFRLFDSTYAFNFIWCVHVAFIKFTNWSQWAFHRPLISFSIKPKKKKRCFVEKKNEWSNKNEKKRWSRRRRKQMFYLMKTNCSFVPVGSWLWAMNQQNDIFGLTFGGSLESLITGQQQSNNKPTEKQKKYHDFTWIYGSFTIVQSCNLRTQWQRRKEKQQQQQKRDEKLKLIWKWKWKQQQNLYKIHSYGPSICGFL